MTERTLLPRSARLALIVPFLTLLFGPSPALALPILGSAESFAVLGASAVTITGATTLKEPASVLLLAMGLISLAVKAAIFGNDTRTR